MNTPILDFVKQYKDEKGIRFHMPGHKGYGPLSAEDADITEIAGADSLFEASGIIRESEENAARLFGSACTVYSAEGSSLCIRAMLTLVKMRASADGRRALILAGRNAHKAFVNGAAVLDLDAEWLYDPEDYLKCTPGASDVEKAFVRLGEEKRLPDALYLTSPDYLGNVCDIAGIAAVCRRYRVPFLVDQAHGAYRRFLPEDSHALTLGADLVCDSAHKTLPVLTGGAYLHLAKSGRDYFGGADPRKTLKNAMVLTASTSPSYLILASLDSANRELAGSFRADLAEKAGEVGKLKKRLKDAGFTLTGDEEMKLAWLPKKYGYSGYEAADMLRKRRMECEFADEDHLVLMFSTHTAKEELEKLEEALLSLERRPEIPECAPSWKPGRAELSLNRALFSEKEEVPAGTAAGRILSEANVACPPAVPIAVMGERITEEEVKAFSYYGVETVSCVKEKEKTCTN